MLFILYNIFLCSLSILFLKFESVFLVTILWSHFFVVVNLLVMSFSIFFSFKTFSASILLDFRDFLNSMEFSCVCLQGFTHFENCHLRELLEHIYCHIWNRLPVQVQCMRQNAQGWYTGMTLRDGMSVQDGEHLYNSGWFMLMYGKNHYSIVK